MKNMSTLYQVPTHDAYIESSYPLTPLGRD